MNISHLNQYKVNGAIRGSAIDEKSQSFFLDVRDETNQKTSLIKLSLPELNAEERNGIDIQWSHLEGVEGDYLYFIEYVDQHDPTKYQYIRLDWAGGAKDIIEEPKEGKNDALRYPYIYEHGSEYFKTVIDFLSVDSPLSCEYLEWEDKIIISYYLRSGNKFERHLILLKDGQKVWKLKQDGEINGFSSGAFFVFQNQLIFIKDLNEVCIYTE